MTDLWFGTSGPPEAEIVIVGEAWGYEEAAEKKPFQGSSGGILNVMLAEAGIQRADVLCTNVVATKPDGNDMWRLFDVKKGAVTPSLRGMHPTSLVRSEIERMTTQIKAHPRKLVITTGNWPLWALTACTNPERPSARNGLRGAPTGVGNWRGSMWHMLDDPTKDCDVRSAKYSDTRLLPIIHPAAIMRQWEERAITVHDLKARVPLALRGDWRHQTKPLFYAPPTFEQATGRLEFWIRQCAQGKLRLASDIETNRGLITVAGFADSTQFAMAIPFVRKTPRGLDSYWTIEQEATIIKLIMVLLSHPNCEVEGQNYIYDTQYFQHWMAVTPSLVHDCMLAQNTLFPGTPKGLDYLSSLYCKYHWYWKEDGKEWDTKGTLEELLVYNCWDLVRTYEVATVQRQLIVQLGQTEQWKIKMQINDLCLRMMNRGIRIDKQRRFQVKMELDAKLSELTAELLDIIPQDMVKPGADTPWYKSSQQKAILFYEILGLPKILDRKTKQPTTGKEALNELRKKSPEWTGLFERLDMYGSAENTSRVLAAGLDSDDRMRCSFNPGGTETHRLSSSKNAFGRGTNLQNLTKGEED